MTNYKIGIVLEILQDCLCVSPMYRNLAIEVYFRAKRKIPSIKNIDMSKEGVIGINNVMIAYEVKEGIVKRI